MSGVEQKTVSADEADMRIDRWFKRHYPALGHVPLQKLLRTGQVRIDGKRAKPDSRVQPGQIVRVPPQATGAADPAFDDRPPRPAVTDRDAAMIRSLVLYKDEDVIVINKPAGLATQGGSKITRHVDGMLPALQFDAEEPPRLVHRLDKDTSGVLMLARTAQAARALTAALKGRTVRKIYWAVTVGTPEPAAGRIVAPLIKGEGPDGERMMVNEERGDSARTLYRVLESVGGSAAFVALWPQTGRTHQLRVHCSDVLGTPILGDGKYGGEAAFMEGSDLPRQMHLHARQVVVPHPRTSIPISVKAPLPDYFRSTLDYFGFDDGDVDDLFLEEA